MNIISYSNEDKPLPAKIIWKIGSWTHAYAAENDTSVSRLLADQLEKQMAQDSEYNRAQERFLSRPGRPLRSQNTPYPTRDTLHER